MNLSARFFRSWHEYVRWKRSTFLTPISHGIPNSALWPPQSLRLRYADTYIVSTFERDAFCVTADYAFNDQGTVSLLNSQRNGGVTGPLSNVTGTATPTDEPGQLGVKFDVQPAFVPPAPYWVVALGPVNTGGLYDYAIVTDNKDLSLFVLARDPATFTAQYDNEVTGFLATNNFNGTLNSPIPTVQDGCTYPASPFEKA